MKRTGAGRRIRTGRETETYKELTAQGRYFCAAAGLIEEAVVLILFGIELGLAPVPVLVFLWFLFAVLTGAFLIGADSACCAFRQMCRRYRSRQTAVRAA